MMNDQYQKKKRKIKDGILNGITYFSSGLSIFILIAIFVFIFSKGFSSLGMHLLTGNYWSCLLYTSQKRVLCKTRRTP